MLQALQFHKIGWFCPCVTDNNKQTKAVFYLQKRELQNRNAHDFLLDTQQSVPFRASQDFLSCLYIVSEICSICPLRSLEALTIDLIVLSAVQVTPSLVSTSSAEEKRENRQLRRNCILRKCWDCTSQNGRKWCHHINSLTDVRWYREGIKVL